MDEVITIALHVEEILERLGVPHAVGGSLASSLHGIPRATQDIDIVADLRSGHVERLMDALSGDFYVSAEAMREAVRDRTRFNAIHVPTMFKVDIYVSETDEVAEAQFARAADYEVVEGSGRSLRVASAEDTVLQKLRWYRLGDEVSDRQWRDALGVLKVQGGDLDLDYLRSMADRMGVAALLERALRTVEEERE